MCDGQILPRRVVLVALSVNQAGLQDISNTLVVKIVGLVIEVWLEDNPSGLENICFKHVDILFGE